MHIIERYSVDTTVLDLRGALRVPDAPNALGAAIQRLIDTGRRLVVLNLEHVTSMDAGGLGALVSAHASMRAHGGSLRLSNVTRRVAHLLAISRLAEVFESAVPAPTAATPGRSPARAAAARRAGSARTAHTPPPCR